MNLRFGSRIWMKVIWKLKIVITQMKFVIFSLTLSWMILLIDKYNKNLIKINLH